MTDILIGNVEGKQYCYIDDTSEPNETMEEIQLATMLPGATPVNEGNVSEVWKGTIVIESGEQKIAFVKLLPINQLLSEVVAAILARELALNMGRPYLVSIARDDLPGARNWPRDEHNRVAFGVEDLKHPSLARFPRDHSTLVSTLLAWTGFKPTSIFDEWIANPDRHPGNLLYDGSEFWLIDHSHAFTGPRWRPETLDPSTNTRNQLLDQAIPTMRSDDRLNWRDCCNTECKKYERIEVTDLRAYGLLDQFCDAEHVDALMAFLANRRSQLLQLMCDKLGIPNLRLTT